MCIRDRSDLVVNPADAKRVAALTPASDKMCNASIYRLTNRYTYSVRVVILRWYNKFSTVRYSNLCVVIFIGFCFLPICPTRVFVVTILCTCLRAREINVT